MPTDRSLNRVKKISRSRFGQQTLHIAKEEISLLASRENTNYPTHQRPAPLKAVARPKSAGRNRFKVGSGINGVLPACGGPPAIYSVPRLSRLRPALQKVTGLWRLIAAVARSSHRR